jgi:hypothetical protein
MSDVPITAGLLLGRDAELAALSGLLPNAGGGRGRAVLVSGEAGIGKTALTEALAGVAERDGYTVAWGRCPDSEAPPYWPWSQVLGALIETDGREVLEGDHPTRAGLFAAVADGLEGATRNRPALVVLEDAHWADPSSLALLRFLVGVVPGLALLLVVTARDEPLELDDDVASTLAGLPPAVLRMPLAGLDEAATAALVAEIAGPGASGGAMADVHRRTGGNPFFISEVARLHAMRGGAPAGGTAGVVDVPAGVRQVLRRRLARLPQLTAELLSAAAVVGRPDVDLLTRVTGRPEEEVLAGLLDSARARLLTDDDAGFRFAHDLVRESVYADLSPTARARLHRRTAEALGPDRPGDLAVHWARAGGDDAHRRAAVHALDAAEAAMGEMGYEQAVRWYRWALDGGAGDAVTVTRRLGEAQVLAGELAAGRETLRRAARLASAAQRPEDLTQAVLAMGSSGFEVDVTDVSQVGLLEEALRTLPPGDSPLRAAALARLSLVRSTVATPDERAPQARAAVEMARRAGDTITEAVALAAFCDAVAGPDHVADRLVAADRMLKLAEAADDPLLVLLARRLRLVARLEQGDLAGVDADIAAYARKAQHLRLPLYIWPVPIWRGMRALLDGDVDGAVRHCAEADALGRQAGSTNAELMVWTLQMAIARTTGTVAEIVSYAESMLESWTDAYPAWHCSFAAIFAEAGQPDRARRHLHRVMAAGMDSIPKDSEWVEVLWQLGQAAMLLDEPEAARAVAGALAPYADQWIVDGIAGACYGPVSDHLARLADYLDGRVGGATAAAATTPPSGTETVETGEFRREGRLWHLRFRGRTATVPDSKGMADLAAVLARPGREVHVLDLVEAGGGPPAAAAEAGTGPVLDARARAAYKARLAELEEDIAAAEADADRGRAERLRAERDFLAVELGAALGLAGRSRTGGDRAERARKAVTMRIGTAVKAIEAVHPDLARHLRLAVSTGRFCVYRPERPTTWTT